MHTLSLMASIWVLLSFSQADPEVFIERVEEFPDLGQSLIPVSPEHGDAYCAPAAAANALSYLAANGYPNLLDGDPQDEAAQLELARVLAGPNYLRTSPEAGTSKERLIAGIYDYVRDRGYRIRAHDYRGLEIYYDPEELRYLDAPILPWLKSRLVAGALCFLQVGWYRSDGGDYRKTGGHWVTLTGHGVDANGTADPAILIIRDPSPRAGAGPSSEYLRARMLDRGRIHGWGLPQRAAGYYDVSDGIVCPSDADTAILEGAVVLELDPP